MNKKLEEFDKYLNGYVKSMEEMAEDYTNIVSDFLEKQKTLSKGEKDIWDKNIKSKKAQYEKSKKDYDDFYATIIEVGRKNQAQELLYGKQHIKNQEAIDGEEVENKQENFNTLLAARSKYAAQIEKINEKIATADKNLTADPNEAKKEKEKKWKDKYDKVAKDTSEISKAIGTSLNTVLDASSKFMDGEIAEVKEKLEAATKELAGFQANLKKQTDDILSRGKAEAQAEIDAQIDADGDGDKRDRKQDKYEELEELERLYNLEAELDKKNEAHKDDINYHAETLTQSEQDRFNTLKTEHATYTQSLDAKTKAEADAEKKKGDLEKEKAKLEGDLKTKESRKKKLEFTKQIVSASVNIAEGVTKALAMGPIIGPIMASIVGAAGAVQIAVMSSQSKKFEDGGLLHGSRHSAGGMRIQGSNIEVEGGEYVVNRQSTDKNLGLLGYINSQRRQLDSGDLHSFFSTPLPRFQHPEYMSMFESGGQVPMLPMSANIDSQILRAIERIDFQPRVSVTDINTVQQSMMKVDEWVGM